MRIAQLHRGIPQDDGENVVEIVRNAGGETANGFHFLRLAKLVLEPNAIGDVLKDEQVIRSAAQFEIFGCDENFARFTGAVRMVVARLRTAWRPRILHGFLPE